MHLPILCRLLDPQWTSNTPPPFRETMFGWNPGMPELNLPDLTAELADQPLACARRDISTILVPQGDQLRGVVEYSTDLFDEATIARFCDEYLDILRDGVKEPFA